MITEHDSESAMSFARRRFLVASAAGLALGGVRPFQALGADPALRTPGLPDGALDSARLDALPGKVPLIKRSWRPPNFETPVAYFNDAFTPNDAPSFVTT